MRMRIYAISDLHVDFRENMEWVEGLSSVDYSDDGLIVAGDLSDDIEDLKRALSILRSKFRCVFFVPGNHDLWIARDDSTDSVTKFRRVLDICAELEVETEPRQLTNRSGGAGLVIAPLFSWYVKPEEGKDSLFVSKEGEDPSLRMWGDSHFVTWPNSLESPSDYFLEINEERFGGLEKSPIISFSHFLPREELIFATDQEKAEMPDVADAHPTFNFSRVAGSWGLDRQIRKLGSAIHVYGHQHRNRRRTIDGVQYISHCFGYQWERVNGLIRNVERGPLLIWDDGPVGELGAGQEEGQGIA